MRCRPEVGRDFRADLHLFRADDHLLAFDVNSGSLHRLDPVAWEIMQGVVAGQDWEEAKQAASRSFPQDQVQEAAGELRELQQAGQLLTPGQQWEDFAPGPELGLKALCLNIAHSCNLSCGYCFVPEGVRRGQELMPAEVIRAAIDFLVRETPYNFLTVDFFGGEPLLNQEGIRLAVSYARDQGRGKDWKFTLTTNVTLMDDRILAFIRENGLSLVLSCDGRPEVHDRFRLNRGGQGTHALVVRRLARFLETGGCSEYYVRGTFTRHNPDFSCDLRYLAELGAESVSLEPVVAGPDDPNSLREADLPALRAEYLRLARLLRELEAGKRVSFYHFAFDLNGGPCVAKRLTGCGAGYQYLAVTPSGELYPCHQFVGHQSYRLGDVWHGITNHRLVESFRQAHVYNKDSCRTCWARFLCGGGCHAQAVLAGGSLLKPNPLTCRIVQARLEGALYYRSLGAAGEVA